MRNRKMIQVYTLPNTFPKTPSNLIVYLLTIFPKLFISLTNACTNENKFFSEDCVIRFDINVDLIVSRIYLFHFQRIQLTFFVTTQL